MEHRTASVAGYVFRRNHLNLPLQHVLVIRVDHAVQTVGVVGRFLFLSCPQVHGIVPHIAVGIPHGQIDHVFAVPEHFRIQRIREAAELLDAVIADGNHAGIVQVQRLPQRNQLLRGSVMLKAVVHHIQRTAAVILRRHKGRDCGFCSRLGCGRSLRGGGRLFRGFVLRGGGRFLHRFPLRGGGRLLRGFALRGGGRFFRRRFRGSLRRPDRFFFRLLRGRGCGFGCRFSRGSLRGFSRRFCRGSLRGFSRRFCRGGLRGFSRRFCRGGLRGFRCRFCRGGLRGFSRRFCRGGLRRSSRGGRHVAGRCLRKSRSAAEGHAQRRQQRHHSFHTHSFPLTPAQRSRSYPAGRIRPPQR